MDHLHLLFGALCLDEGEVEARSMLAFSLVIGHHFMAADHGARSHADVLKLAANWRSDSQPETGMHITAAHRRRSDRTCPAIHDTDDPALIAVQGAP